MTPDLFQTDQLLERIEILEKKMDELMKILARFDTEGIIDKTKLFDHAARTVVCSYPSPDFLAFWEAYPRKQGMKPAWQAWRKCRTRPEIHIIVEAVKRQKKSKQWKDGIIPLPATWINQERFDDEV